MNAVESELLKFQGLIRAVVTNVAGQTLDRNDLQDIIQETNLKVLTNTFDPNRGSMAGWVSTIAHNQAVSALRRWNRHAKPASDALESAESGSSDPDASDAAVYLGDLDMADPASTDILHILSRERLKGKIESVIGQLDDDDLHFLLISLKEGFSYEAYARELGTSEVALRVRKHRLAQQLRLMLSKLDS